MELRLEKRKLKNCVYVYVGVGVWEEGGGGMGININTCLTHPISMPPLFRPTHPVRVLPLI